jgi:2-succinyl-6-hydroxy-2,4-cyclohexadiene-1-carboxylate synthase
MARFVVNGYDVFVEQWHEEARETLVLLHGFTGSTKTWHKVVELLPNSIRIVAVDLMGHGQSAAPEDVNVYSMQKQVELLDQLFTQLQLKEFSLVGYSMGGRVALSYVVQYSARVKQLILESASPGLVLEKERLMRRQADEALAHTILEKGMVSFVDQWENIPLFASQKELPLALQYEIRSERLAQREIGLVNSLRGMGTGVMPPLWEELFNLKMPVTLITGDLDKKFVELNNRMQKNLPNSEHVIIPSVGHAIHVENPIKFATIVNETI